MKKFLNASLLLLGFVTLCSLGCRSWLGPAEPKAEAGLSAGEYLEARTRRLPPAPSAPEEAPSIPSIPLVGAEMPPAVRPDMVAVTASGSSIVSKTYPWAECGVVQLDKTMPKEVGLNKQFTYSIKVTNLTNTELTDIIVSEDLPEGFKYLSANPAPKQEQGNILEWELSSLAAKSVREISITGLRSIASSEGVVIAAGGGGKRKTALQMTGILCLIIGYPYHLTLGAFDLGMVDLVQVGRWLVYISLIFSLVSAFQYVGLFAEAVEAKNGRTRG